MNSNYFVVFSSITVATGVKKILERRGITASLLHTPKSIQLNGCSYSIKIKEKYYTEVLSAAKDAGAHVLAVFKALENGYEEVGMP